jgi:SAM-dependent methyltransferase
MPNSTITEKLYQEYYRTDHTPDGLVSSYWKDMHPRTKVIKSDSSSLALSGVGFGDFECQKWHHLVLAWTTTLIYLGVLKDRMAIIRMMGRARPLLKRLGFPMTNDAFRFMCVMALLERHIPSGKKFRVINIGDGYGFLSAFIKELYPQAQICFVDLGKTLLFQAHYCSKAFPNAKHHLVSGPVSQQDAEADFIYCPAENLKELDALRFDVAINIASMQEMNVPTVRHYFDFLRQHMNTQNFFYCCNRTEKVLPGGELLKYFDFPWEQGDKYLVDEVCPWHKFYLATHQEPLGPRLAGVRIPFINYYDGAVWHRVAVLQTH